ncbi:MAG: bifunctional folylpolyglutamate synthase/dihydrofolate synthase [Verrucomicrobiales bacterium]|nr:bifunctional folylpolyglutamate synthase/dihydrofolate synthase [Verrucomicrobiales bacterium]
MSVNSGTLNFNESIDWLYGTQTFGIKLGLENTQRLLAESGLAELPEGMKVIHVAGTNGKGSVCAFSEQILRDAGIKTGLFTSPHLITYRERVRVNGEMIDEATVARILSELREKVADWETHPTFFELSLVLAMRHFVDEGCEAVLLETGMGGRLDSTNAVQSDVSVITPIALDHQQWLGDTIREIAGEKAGILKRHVPVVVADFHPEARDVIGRKALTLGIPYIEAHPLPTEWELGLAGPHQRENAALAVEATCRIVGEKLTQEGIQKSLAATSWPGRFQEVRENIFVDGAHNEAAAKALCLSWQEKFPDEKVTLIFGAAESKAVTDIFRQLLPITEAVTFVPIKSERKLASEKMDEALREAGGGSLPVMKSASLAEALEAAQSSEGKTLVAGSLFLAGEALGILDGVSFEVSLQ